MGPDREGSGCAGREQSSRLGRAVGRAGYFALAFGAIVGSGWVIVLGDWLMAAGPGGTVLAFLAGGAVMMLIGLCYGELAARFPRAGAEFLYVRETLGRLPAFLVGWYITLYAVATCGFEAIALAWIVRTLLPSIGLGAAYHVHGSAVTWDALLIGLAGALLLGALHTRGAAAAIRFQNAVTFGFILLMVMLIAAALVAGQPERLQPAFESVPPGTWITGALWTFGSCAFFLNGWQTALHAIEERRPDVTPRAAVMSSIAAILTAALFYGAVVLAAGSAVPWRGLVGQNLPAVAAFTALPGGRILGAVILAATAISLVKTWSAMIWVASRLLYAQARQGLLPAALARVDPESGVPRPAIYLVTSLTVLAVAIGRGAILPIVNMVSTCMALSFVLCLIVLIKCRRLDGPRPSFTVPGGTPVIACAATGACLMVGTALAEPWIRSEGAIPPEWFLLVAWGAAALVAWRIRTDPAR